MAEPTAGHPDARRIVVTGARSFVARLLIDHLAGRPEMAATGVVSPRADAGPAPVCPCLSADLTQPLPAALARALNGAERVFHFAWDRIIDRDAAMARNRAMIDNLIDAMSDPAGFVFISTTSAGPAAPGTYGAVNFAMEAHVRARGGTVLVLGLIADADAGTAYRAISGAVRGLPLHFIFDGGFRFFPLTPAEAIAAFKALLDEAEPGTYGAFPPGGVDAATFIGEIERAAPRLRIPAYVPRRAILGAVRWIWPAGLRERLATFLYFDAARLAAVRPLGPVAAEPDTASL